MNAYLMSTTNKRFLIYITKDFDPSQILSLQVKYTYKKIDGLIECHSRIFQPSVLISFIGLLGIIYKIAVQLLSLVGPKFKVQYLNSKAPVSYLRSPKLYTKNLFIVFFFKAICLQTKQY